MKNNLLFKTTPLEILLEIPRDHEIPARSLKTGVTYSRIYQLLMMMWEEGLIDVRKDRQLYVRLSKTGWELARMVEEFKNIVGDFDEKAG